MTEQIETKRELIKWIKKCENCMVFTDSVQSGADGVFKVSGTNGSKPDLVITKRIDDNYWNIAVEVKPGEHNKQILDGIFQTVRYAGEYTNEDTIYSINDNKIRIHFFVLATAYSPYGYLYKKEQNYGLKTGDFVMFDEKPVSAFIWRFIWRLWQNEQKRYMDKTIIRKNHNITVGILAAKLKDTGVPEQYVTSDEPYIIQENKCISLK